MSEDPTVIIDSGSTLIKAGLAGDECPRSAFPSIIGRPKYAQAGNKDVLIGDKAAAKCGILMIKSPIENGIVKDWESMEKIWHHTFYEELKIDPSEQALLLAESSSNSKPNREKMIQIMFEVFNVPALGVFNQAVLALFSSGRKSGTVVEIGSAVSQVVPIVQYKPVSYATMQTDFGGNTINSSLHRSLGRSLSSSFVDKETVRDIKEKHCYVALDYDAELSKAKKSSSHVVSYTKYDGSKIKIAEERFVCTELLFKPSLVGCESDGIDQTLVDAIGKCDNDVQKNLYANIVLSGGSTSFEGFTERFEKGVTSLAPKSCKVKISSPQLGKYAVWKGGSDFASHPTFSQKVVQQSEYEDAGPGVFSRCQL